MPAPIKLHHFGEPLVSAVIDHSISSHTKGLEAFFHFLKHYSFVAGHKDNSDSTESKILELRKQLIGNVTTDTIIKFKLPGYSFDSEHSIDVGIVGEKVALPIEVKMGFVGKIVSWDKFLTEEIFDRQIRIKQKTKSTLKGSVPAFLTHQVHKSLGKIGQLKTIDDKEISSTWCLCVRDKVIEDYQTINNEIRLDIKHCPLVFAFEDLINVLHPENQDKLFQNIWISSKEALMTELQTTKTQKSDKAA